MDEQKYSTVSLSTARSSTALERPRICRPRYSHLENRQQQTKSLKQILFSFNRTLRQHPEVINDSSAFARMAIAHGYPCPDLNIRNRAYDAPYAIQVRVTAKLACLGRELMAIWKHLSPDVERDVALRAKLTTNKASHEPLAPGPIRMMQLALKPLMEDLNLAVIKNLDVLESPFAFFQLAIAHGYIGPGATHTTDTANDLNSEIGRRLISVWRDLALA